MNVVRGFPPNYEKIRKYFQPGPRVLFTYGDTIYNPSGVTIAPDFMVHEKVHTVQQGGDPDAWWELYCIDPVFRLGQEMDACQQQFKFFKAFNGRQQTRLRLRQLGKMLSGSLYNNMITYAQAVEKIKNYG